jgi:long-chain acyl-CoA synthetase
MDVIRNFTLGDLVREHARSYPDRTSFVCGGERWTFSDTNARVNRLTHALRANGVARGETVLWLAQNCHRSFETLFACAKLGAAMIPANWRASGQELAYVVDDARPAVIVWQASEIGDRVAGAREASANAASATWVRHDDGELEAWIAGAPDEEPDELVDEDQPVLRMYTAAFEGRPRGALLTHRNVVTSNLHLALAQRLSWEDTTLVSLPLFHVLQLAHALAAYHVAATECIVPRVDPEAMCRLVAEERVRRAVVIGPTVRQMMDAAKAGGFDLSSLRTPAGGHGADAEAWAAMTDPSLPPLGGYGQTELAGQATYDAWGPPRTGSHGHAAPTAIVRILDEDGRELPPGETGEIVVRGPQVMAGYAGAPDVDEARFRGGWQHTGDLGRREHDGSVSFVGPRTELIKSGAENVYPAEVEAVIARHPSVRHVCVIGVPDPKWRQAVKAVVVLRDGATANADDIVAFVKDRIASYKKPRDVEFVDALPATATGAVDRDAVKRRWG